MKFIVISAQMMINGERLYVQSQVSEEAWNADRASVEEWARMSPEARRAARGR